MGRTSRIYVNLSLTVFFFKSPPFVTYLSFRDRYKVQLFMPFSLEFLIIGVIYNYEDFDSFKLF